ncbi:MAG: N-acetylmuramic acid 6-phosphate etherase [Lachnospiraceae bacterium]|nr:N-acetylmuramic acid 6-phosphate etherase [Lachnospiraceae bacterium]
MEKIMLKTEMRNEKTMHIDRMSVADMLKIMNEENQAVLEAIDKALPEIEQVCNLMTKAIQDGGRVFYVGAGTSGRLGILDAAECPPTYGVSRDLFNGIIAGGRDCVFQAAENAEDRAELGAEDLKRHDLCEKDVVIGISAAGGAAYVAGALEYAKSLQAKTAAITNNPDTKISKIAEVTIFADTGAEVITGSTRMKAGTAQKIILNMLSTASMIRCGHVYENLMINLKPSNKKLRNRMIGIVCDITGLQADAAQALLEENDWNIRAAVETEK